MTRGTLLAKHGRMRLLLLGLLCTAGCSTADPDSHVADSFDAGTPPGVATATATTVVPPPPAPVAPDPDADSDVGCGGAHSPKCAAGKTCRTHDNCASGACPDGTCSESPSCKQLAGGATCGSGEVGEANAKHEDCCASATVPRAASAGGPFRMDKYLITAGRMRTFLESVNYDVRGWIVTHRPAWWTGPGVAATPGLPSWDDMLPTNKTKFIELMSGGDQTYCYIQPPEVHDESSLGGPAYWLSPEDLKATYATVGTRLYTQDQLDVKVMNCFRAPLFEALCAFDGGRLATHDEWAAAMTVKGVKWDWPWKQTATFAQIEPELRTHGAYARNKFWPREPLASENDLGGYLPAPGRFPLGNGPYGHADLFGGLEMQGAVVNTDKSVAGDGWFQLSFQEDQAKGGHHYGGAFKDFGTGKYRNHWAVGGRCTKN